MREPLREAYKSSIQPTQNRHYSLKSTFKITVEPHFGKRKKRAFMNAKKDHLTEASHLQVIPKCSSAHQTLSARPLQAIFLLVSVA